MKKLIYALIIIMPLFILCVHASEMPYFVRVGINSSSLAESVTIASDGGIYTESAFAKPPETEEEVPEEATPEETTEEAETEEVVTEESAEDVTAAEEESTDGEASSEESEENVSYYIADSVTVTVGEDGTLICNGIATGETEVDFLKISEFLTCQNKKYRGAVRLSVKRGKILIVNVLSMDEYLYGVVGREMSEGFPLEALKAQSVAARNYAIISMGRHNSEGFDLCNGVHCQAYGGVTVEGQTVRQAVDETSGKLLYYNGKVVECYYFSSSGGYTENSENVWVAKIGYLKGKTDPFEDPERIPGYNWEETFTPEEVKNSLASRGIDIGDILNIEVTEYSDNQHAIELKITGTDGEKYYYKDNIRAAFPKQLKSTLFTVSGKDNTASVKVLSVNGLETRKITPSFVLSGDGMSEIASRSGGDGFVFTGKGSGHGVGMSQYGAYFMAEQGYTYDEILKFYYTDTEIKDYES